MKKRSRTMRVHDSLKEIVSRIEVKRINMGLDKRMKSSRRLTLAMSRHPLMKQIEEDIINADLEE